ncbi:MAG: SPOR domain-containing protein [Pseudomonadota bacterium]
MSLVPRSLRRYRRDHPYSHPFLFLVVDVFDSLLQILLVCGVIYAGYHVVANSTNKNETVVESTPPMDQSVPLVVDNSQGVIETSVIEAKVINASSVTTTSEASNSPSTTDATRLLDGIHGIRWVNSLPTSHYTIQFAASIDKEALIEFADEHLTRGAVIYPFKLTNNNEPMYGVASGLYDSLYSAMQAIDKLPAPLQQHGPWVRPVTELQKQVAETKS